MPIEQAKIAIKAMREPTDAMIKAGLNVDPMLSGRIPYIAMIDAALKE